jgi:penicillin amidase
MKYLGFFLCLSISVTLAVVLSLPIGQVPPLATLLSPFHGFWQNAYSEDDLALDQVEISGLSEPVQVLYDEHLIPHIFAANEEDLFKVQGFVTAQHRLWQMEFQSMAAAGRLSEIVGAQALEFDRMQRRKGLTFGAEQGLAFIQKEDPETFRLITAYAEGVNRYISSLTDARLPLEYKLLNYRPEPWSAYKTVLLLKYMADMLVGDKDLEFTDLRQLIGAEWMEKLFPDFPLDNDPVIEAEKTWEFKPLPVVKPDHIIYPDSTLLIDPLPSPEPGVGSNNWAVSAKKTKNGHPILANDPHLSLNMPSLWYAMQLSTPEYSVKGATLPGALGVISGFNESIAWGVTNATRDLRDWYAITFKDGKKEEYFYDGQWRLSERRIEKIEIKNESSFTDTIIYTHHGPVVYDESFRTNGQKINFALKWTAHDGSNEQRAFLSLNRGKNHSDFIAALNHYAAPAQNFVFASSSGDIAMKVQGKFPRKWEGQGKYLMDGSSSASEWQGYIPSDENPATLNPERGFVSSANQHSVDPSYPYYVFDPSFEHYRNRRLNNRLREMTEVSIEDMKALQFDNFHLHAAEALPVMLQLLSEDSSLLVSPAEEEVLKELKKWNFHTSPEQTEPPLFAEWWDALEEMIWGRWKEEGRSILFPNSYQTTQLLREEPESEIFDHPDTPEKETASHWVGESFKSMARSIKERREREEDPSWAAYKKTSIQHLVPNFKAFGYHDIHTGGGRGILNATSERHGASWRMVVEMGEEVKAFGIYPGGQSGNPGSKFYGNFIKKWSRGGYLNLDLMKREDFEQALFITTFKPK